MLQYIISIGPHALLVCMRRVQNLKSVQGTNLPRYGSFGGRVTSFSRVYDTSRDKFN